MLKALMKRNLERLLSSSDDEDVVLSSQRSEASRCGRRRGWDSNTADHTRDGSLFKSKKRKAYNLNSTVPSELEERGSLRGNDEGESYNKHVAGIGAHSATHRESHLYEASREGGSDPCKSLKEDEGVSPERQAKKKRKRTKKRAGRTDTDMSSSPAAEQRKENRDEKAKRRDDTGSESKVKKKRNKRAKRMKSVQGKAQLELEDSGDNPPAVDARESYPFSGCDAQQGSMKPPSKKHKMLRDSSLESTTKKKMKKKALKDDQSENSAPPYITDSSLMSSSAKEKQSQVMWLGKHKDESVDDCDYAAGDALSQTSSVCYVSDLNLGSSEVRLGRNRESFKEKTKKKRRLDACCESNHKEHEGSKAETNKKRRNGGEKDKKRKDKGQKNIDASKKRSAVSLLQNEASESTRSRNPMEIAPNSARDEFLKKKARKRGSVITSINKEGSNEAADTVVKSCSSSGHSEGVADKQSRGMSSNDELTKSILSNITFDGDSEPEFSKDADDEWRDYMIIQYLQRAKEALAIETLEDQNSALKSRKPHKKEESSRKDKCMRRKQNKRKKDKGEKNLFKRQIRELRKEAKIQEQACLLEWTSEHEDQSLSAELDSSLMKGNHIVIAQANFVETTLAEDLQNCEEMGNKSVLDDSQPTQNLDELVAIIDESEPQSLSQSRKTNEVDNIVGQAQGSVADTQVAAAVTQEAAADAPEAAAGTAEAAASTQVAAAVTREAAAGTTEAAAGTKEAAAGTQVAAAGTLKPFGNEGETVRAIPEQHNRAEIERTKLSQVETPLTRRVSDRGQLQQLKASVRPVVAKRRLNMNCGGTEGRYAALEILRRNPSDEQSRDPEASEAPEAGQRPGAAGAALRTGATPKETATAQTVASPARGSDQDRSASVDRCSKGHTGGSFLCSMRLIPPAATPGREKRERSQAPGVAPHPPPAENKGKVHKAEPRPEAVDIHPSFALDQQLKMFAYEKEIGTVLLKYMPNAGALVNEFFEMPSLIRPAMKAVLLTMHPDNRKEAMADIKKLLPPPEERKRALIRLFNSMGSGTVCKDFTLFMPGEASCRLDMGLAWTALEE